MGLAVRAVREDREPRPARPAPPNSSALLEYYFAPEAPFSLGRDLLLSGKVTACMDISDGLSTDLSRLCAASGCGAVLDGEAVPCAPELLRAVPDERARLDLVLGSGEEFQLLFTSPEDLPWPAIGRITGEKGLTLHWRETAVPLKTTGYDHFGNHPQASA